MFYVIIRGEQMKILDKKEILIDGLRKSREFNDFVKELPSDARPSEISVKLHYKHKSPNELWKEQSEKNKGE